jgi:hypothetical protein
VLAIAGLGSAPAESRPLVAGLSEPNESVELARGGVAFTESREYRDTDSGRYLVELKAPGKARRVLATVTPTRSKRYGWPEALEFDFSVSRRFTVVGKEEMQTEGIDDFGDDNNVARDSLDAYSAGGKRILHEKCLRSPYLALDDATLATFGDGCGHDDLTIRDLSGEPRVVRRFDAATSTYDVAAVAGDLVAYATGDTGVTVANWRSGAVTYHVERPDLDAYAIALGADGTLVAGVANPQGRQCTSALVFEPLEQAGRRLPQRFCGDFRLVGRELAFVTRRNGAWNLDLANIDTGAASTHAIEASRSFGALDFDGSHVAWEEQRCHDYAIFRRSLSAPAHPPAPVRCPVHFARRSLHMNSRGEIAVPLRCPRGCTLPDAYMTVKGLRYPLSSHSLRSRPGRLAKLRFPTDAMERARLRRIGPTRVDLEVRSYEPSNRVEVTYRKRLRLRP